MQDVFLSIVPIFLLIVLGHVLRRGGIPSFEFWNLNDKLVYWVLMPALLFSKISAIHVESALVGSFAVVILGGFAVAVVFALVSARALGVGWTPLLAGEVGGSTDLGVLMARSGWTHVEDVPAYYLNEYGCHAPTYGDSTESGIPWTEYMIITNTEDHWIFWESESASGYSVDNVAPGAPAGLLALPAQADVELYWSPSGYVEDDLVHYNIYRSETSWFGPDETTLVDATTDKF